MKEFMDSTGLTFIVGMAVGLFLELVAVYLTMYIVKRNKPQRPAGMPETRIITDRPAEPPLARPAIRSAPVGQSYRREPVLSERPQQRAADTSPHSSIVVGRTSSDIRRPAPPLRVERPAVERIVEPVVEQVITEELPPAAPALSKAALSRAPQLLYFVTGIEEPYNTLREAVDAFPDERGRYDDKPVQWSSLPKYVRDNIQRREIAT